MPANYVCPKCKAINPDNWKVCNKCNSIRPSARKAVPRYLPKGALNVPDIIHLMWCLKRVQVHNLPNPIETSDIFWLRHEKLTNKLRKILEE
jgi:hypothetical protein